MLICKFTKGPYKHVSFFAFCGVNLNVRVCDNTPSGGRFRLHYLGPAEVSSRETYRFLRFFFRTCPKQTWGLTILVQFCPGLKSVFFSNYLLCAIWLGETPAIDDHALHLRCGRICFAFLNESMVFGCQPFLGWVCDGWLQGSGLACFCSYHWDFVSYTTLVVSCRASGRF